MKAADVLRILQEQGIEFQLDGCNNEIRECSTGFCPIVVVYKLLYPDEFREKYHKTDASYLNELAAEDNLLLDLPWEERVIILKAADNDRSSPERDSLLRLVTWFTGEDDDGP